jgi:hypothetical protein
MLISSYANRFLPSPRSARDDAHVFTFMVAEFQATGRITPRRISCLPIKEIYMRQAFLALAAIVLALGLGACGHDVATQPSTGFTSTLASDHSMAGASGQMDAYYDDQIFTVNMFELSDDASERIIESNQSLNEIYATNDLDEEQDFDPVLDAIQGDGFNPLWRQVLITWNPGFTPHQFTSDTDIEAAADAGEITLTDTDEVYRCSVVGQKTTTEE